jgi:hypothetical protein
MADKITRVYCRENQLTVEAAESLNVGGGLTSGSYNGHEKKLVLTYEMVLEWGQPKVIRKPWVSADGKSSGVELRRVGKLAWIKLVVNVYSDQHQVNADIYSVALQASVQSLHAQHMFEFVGMPDAVVREMPAPSTWAIFDQKAYEDACAKIQAAQAKLSELADTYEPAETELLLGVIPNPDTQFVKSAVLGIDCLSASLAGRVEWDAEATAHRMGLDPSVCRQVYSTFGETNPYALPGASINRTATDWNKFITGK